MKKAFLMLVLFIVPFALQAQTKFHDVEANDAKGAVKSITSNRMGNPVSIKFTQDGKMQQEPNAGGNIEVQLKMNGIKMQDGNAKILDGMTQIFMNSSIIIRIISNKFKH